MAEPREPVRGGDELGFLPAAPGGLLGAIFVSVVAGMIVRWVMPQKKR